MPRVSDIISLPNIPIGLVRTYGKQVTYNEVTEFLKKSPSPVQKLTYLTSGGLILTIVGAFTTLFSKAENIIGSLLLLTGLGVTATGFALSPCYSYKQAEENVQEDKTASTDEPKKVNGEKEVVKQENSDTAQNPNDTSCNTTEELILILLNKVKGKKFTAKARVLAALELGKRKAKEAVIPLITCLKDKFKSVIEASITALGKIGGSEAFHALHKFSKDDSLPQLIRIKATNAMREALKKQN